MSSILPHAAAAAFALGALFATVGAIGQERLPRRPPPLPSPCNVTVEDEGGRALPTFHQAGRTYLLGERGARYSIRVNNRSGARVEAVISVDGRDGITGQPADYVRHRGYVLAPYDSVTVQGFRQSFDAVAAFRFATPGESYSSRMGTPENVGVLGIACFSERRASVVHVPPPSPFRYRDQTEASRSQAPSAERPAGRPSARSAPTDRKERAERTRPGYPPEPRGHTGNLGTEYGESRYSPVSTTAFERADQGRAQQVIVLHYDDAGGLEARGIRVFSRPERMPWHPSPQPFPGSRFAPPPP
ncbi:MAG: hypothetical protein JW751_31680 [Polyangiaceae bacterium]|nr:hypothetical protein [Polyangiaceae bacterium]